MNRREFLYGFGGLVAVSSLPSYGGGDDGLFSKRGKFERLVLAYQHIDVGATKPFSILHISDTHLSSAYEHESKDKLKLAEIRSATFGGRQEEALRDSLSWAKKNVDYVLHTGDMIDWQSEANYDLVKKYYGGIALGAVGNHEYSESMWLSNPKEEGTEAYRSRSRKRLAEVYGYDVSFHSQVVNGVNFVMIDDVYGFVTKDQVDRFAEEVKKGLPIILCKHVPFYSPHLWRADMKFWSPGKKFVSAEIPAARGDYLVQQKDDTTRKFIAYLKTEKLLKGILAGHMHITVQDRFSPSAMQYVVGGNFMFHGEEILFT